MSSDSLRIILPLAKAALRSKRSASTQGKSGGVTLGETINSLRKELAFLNKKTHELHLTAAPVEVHDLYHQKVI